MSEGQCWTQKVAHTVEVMLVLLDGFDAHPLPGQQGLVTRRVAWWRHELKVSMSTAEEEPNSEVTQTEEGLIFIKLTLIKTLLACLKGTRKTTSNDSKLTFLITVTLK